MKKAKLFNDLVFKKFGNHKGYDRLIFQFNRSRDILSKSHVWFRTSTANKQFDICTTVLLITVDTERQYMNENMPLSLPDKSKQFPYSLNYGYKKPVVISLSKQLKK